MFGWLSLFTMSVLRSQPLSKGHNEVQYVLKKIGVEQSFWKTLIVTVSRETDISAETLWNVWSRIEDWNKWSQPLHDSAQWIHGNEWKNGNTFTQILELGFPFGKTISHETVGEVDSGKYVSWWKDEKCVAFCHLWKFESLPNGHTRISNTEVFHGLIIGLIKPFIRNSWERIFLQSVDGLIQYSQTKSRE